MNMLEALSMGADLSNFRVMVVDDSRTWRMILTQELKALGMGNITQAKHGVEALELAQSTPLDLILLDIEMPEMDGLAVLENLKQSNLLQSLSVIVISGGESMEKTITCIETGADDYLPKPFNSILLRARILSAYEKKLLRDQERARVEALNREKERLNQENQQFEVAQGVMKNALTVAEAKLASLVETGIEVSSERDRGKLLRKILHAGKQLSSSDAGTMYLKTEQGHLRIAEQTKEGEPLAAEIPLMELDGSGNRRSVAAWVAHSGKTVVVDDAYAETRFDFSDIFRVDARTGYRTVSILAVPMRASSGDIIGVLEYVNSKDPRTAALRAFPGDFVGFVEALAAQSAVALENQNLLEAQKGMMDSMIQLLAGAIDTKSPYTGGHCERVPELGILLAQEACKIKEGPLAHFEFKTDDEWREFRIGAWLHDCGKITTPEYVVDKATKLETIYNRIHEIRTRFEVLLRDAHIDCLRSVHEQGVPAEQAQAELAQREQQLLDDFAFVAECNVGAEFMAPDKVERLRRIGQQAWLRHFDDRLGLSHLEVGRYERTLAEPLPVIENLLSDKAHHLIERPNTSVDHSRHGFNLEVPEHLYNYGEVYNLSIGRGTLTEEERFKIKEHMVQTVVMLEAMPLPANLKRVPEYAGTHHETLIGTGYPRALPAEKLSVPSRIMAIADIFEALTASDRPYKKAKTLSESVKLLHFFVKDGHLDPDLFELFLSSGVYVRYAERFLKPEQIDEVDVAKYVPLAPGIRRKETGYPAAA